MTTTGRRIIDPDEEVQAAIADVFKAFAQTGSAYGVVGVFSGRRFPKPRLRRRVGGRAALGRAHARACAGRAVATPATPGAYVFGRYRYRRVVRPDGTITTKMIELPRSEWAVVIHDHHAGYISWERSSPTSSGWPPTTRATASARAREGSALCQGIVRCGACGRIDDHASPPRGQLLRVRALPRRSLNTPGVPRRSRPPWSTSSSPAGCWRRSRPSRSRLRSPPPTSSPSAARRSDRALELRVERARYEAIRAERAFHACEPDNRLVARSLETRWEQKLRELKDAEAELAEHVVPRPSPRASRSRRSPATCRAVGRRTAPPTRTASGCYAR